MDNYSSRLDQTALFHHICNEESLQFLQSLKKLGTHLAVAIKIQ